MRERRARRLAGAESEREASEPCSELGEAMTPQPWRANVKEVERLRGEMGERRPPSVRKKERREKDK